jgi:hypothetical protein
MKFGLRIRDPPRQICIQLILCQIAWEPTFAPGLLKVSRSRYLLGSHGDPPRRPVSAEHLSPRRLVLDEMGSFRNGVSGRPEWGSAATIGTYLYHLASWWIRLRSLTPAPPPFSSMVSMPRSRIAEPTLACLRSHLRVQRPTGVVRIGSSARQQPDADIQNALSAIGRLRSEHQSVMRALAFVALPIE